MKSTQVWSALRSPLAPLAKVGGWARLKSSPPSFSKPHGHQALSLWFKHRSAGWDAALGGTFTGALQLSSEPQPGIEWTGEKDFASERLPKLFASDDWSAALEIHNAVVAKLVRPPKGHWIYTMAEDVQNNSMKVLERRDDLRSDLDYWFLYHDERDAAAWGAFIASRVHSWVDRFEVR